MTHDFARLHAALSPEEVLRTAADAAAKAAETITASRGKLRNLPRQLSHESLVDIAAQIGVPVADAGGVDPVALDTALRATGLSVTDRIRLKSLMVN